MSFENEILHKCLFLWETLFENKSEPREGLCNMEEGFKCPDGLALDTCKSFETIFTASI